MRYFLIPKSRDFGIEKRSGIPGSGIPGLQSLMLTVDSRIVLETLLQLFLAKAGIHLPTVEGWKGE